MKTFKQFLQEAKYPNETFQEKNIRERANAKISNQHVGTVNGWKVIPSIHSMSQAVEHLPEKSVEDWNNLHKKITRHFSMVSRLHSNSPQYNGVHYSKSLGHGIVIAVNPKGKSYEIITTLEKGHKKSTHDGDKTVIMEQFKDFPTSEMIEVE